MNTAVTGVPVQKALPAVGEDATAFDIDIPDDAEYLLVGGGNVRFTPPRALTAVDCGGTPLGSIRTQISQASGSDYIRGSLWAVMNPPKGVKTIHGTWDGAARGSMFALCLKGGDYASIVVNSGSAHGLAIDTILNGLTIDLFLAEEGDSTTIAVAIATELLNFIGSAGAGGSAVRSGVASRLGDGTNQTTTWTPTGAAGFFAHLAVHIPPAPSGAPPTAGFDATMDRKTATVVDNSIAGTNPITSVQYDYGDGTGRTAATVHAYAAPGAYTITQYVNDSVTAEQSATVDVVTLTGYGYRLRTIKDGAAVATSVTVIAEVPDA